MGRAAAWGGLRGAGEGEGARACVLAAVCTSARDACVGALPGQHNGRCCCSGCHTPHALHQRAMQSCIDPWLMKRTTCPLCRCDLVPAELAHLQREAEGGEGQAGDLLGGAEDREGGPR